MTPRIRYPGHYRAEADDVRAFAIDRGMSRPRAWALACYASYGRKVWTFQSTLAKFTGFCVRTIQRAVRQGKSFGILISKRIKRGETPKGGRGPLRCGAAMKTFVGWGMPEGHALICRAKEAVRAAFRDEQRAELRASLPALDPP